MDEMNEETEEAVVNSARSVRAIRTAAMATHVAQYGEEAAAYIDGLVVVLFHRDTLLTAARYAPPAVALLMCNVLNKFVTEIASWRAGASAKRSLTRPSTSTRRPQRASRRAWSSR